ncbi:MAG: Na+/H+ antiporter subunit E [Wenzhouxiangellaceae bacterium]
MNRVHRWVQLSTALFVFWLVLSMPLDFSDLLWGLAAAAAAGGLASRFLWPEESSGIGARNLAGLVVHTFDLVRQIVPAALQVARVVLDPALPIQPKIIVHRTSLDSDLERVTLANSITLTPGTHCVDLEGDSVTVHCLSSSFVEPLIEGSIETRISSLLGHSEADE